MFERDNLLYTSSRLSSNMHFFPSGWYDDPNM